MYVRRNGGEIPEGRNIRNPDFGNWNGRNLDFRNRNERYRKEIYRKTEISRIRISGAERQAAEI